MHVTDVIHTAIHPASFFPEWCILDKYIFHHTGFSDSFWMFVCACVCVWVSESKEVIHVTPRELRESTLHMSLNQAAVK